MSLRENIAKNIVDVLGDMNPPRPVLVTREPFDVQKLALTQFPAILVTTGNETREEHTMGGNRRAVLEMLIQGFVRSDGRDGFVQSVDEKRNEMIERIEETLNTDRTRELSSTTAVKTRVTAVEVNQERQPPLGEFTVTCEVHYTFTTSAA
tara:strand:+ start:120 stop:572 length:453 start_codon:yes stop_codon:yes gene_type:complete